LAPSTKTTLTFEGAGDFSGENFSGRNFHYGVRELAMGSVLNGLSTCKLRPYGSGFLVFSDFSRPALRLSALMDLPVLYVFTHDSIGVGEDGPTHQPVEHLAALRAIPGVVVMRPGDPNEIAECYRLIAQETKRPTCLILSRQKMVTLSRTEFRSAKGVAQGAYILADNANGADPDVILMASGTEIGATTEAYRALASEGISARLVSVPSWEIFEEQSREYRDSVLPPRVRARVAVEAASTFGWERYVGLEGEIVGMKTFGASAPLKELTKKYGLTVEDIVATAKRLAPPKRELTA
jgi:transketolase